VDPGCGFKHEDRCVYKTSSSTPYEFGCFCHGGEKASEKVSIENKTPSPVFKEYPKVLKKNLS
jgi:hypothetical protein